MAPWDSKIRWRFGGNLQRVRLICEFNWRECPLALANYVWSEIVTDVIECLTGEGILLRIIILILVCTILFYTIWSRTRWMTDNIINRENLNRIDFKVQDLELRVNVLTYKMQYGTWPSPQQIKGTNIEEQKDIAEISVTSSTSHNSLANQCFNNVDMKNRHISKSENLGLRLNKPKMLIETSRKIYCNRPTEMHNLGFLNGKLEVATTFTKLAMIESRSEKIFKTLNNNEEYQTTKEIHDCKMDREILEKKESRESEYNFNVSNKMSDTSKFIYNNISAVETAESSCEESENTLPTSPHMIFESDKSPRTFSVKESSTVNLSVISLQGKSTHEILTDVKERLENLHMVLKTYGSPENSEQAGKENIDDNKIVEKDQDNKINFDAEVKNPSVLSNKKETNSLTEEKGCEIKSLMLVDTDEDLGSISSQPEPSKGGSESDKSTQSSDALMLSALLNQLDLSSLKRWNDKFSEEKSDDDSETDNSLPKIKNFYQSKLLDIISEEHSGSSGTEKRSATILPRKVIQDTNNSSVPLIELNSIDCPVELRQMKNEIESKVENDILNTVKSVDRQNELILHPSEENFKNTVSDSSQINNLLDIQNEQLVDICDTGLKPSRRISPIANFTNDSICDNEAIKNQMNDLIDLTFDDNEGLTICNNVCEDFERNLMDVTNNVFDSEDIKYSNDDVSMTGKTVTHSEESNLINFCRDSSSSSKILIKLESLTFDELTRTENCWDSKWTSNNYELSSIIDVTEFKDVDSQNQYHNKTLLCDILSSPSSDYLTGQDSLSEVSMEARRNEELSKNFEQPVEGKNMIEDEKCTVMSKDSALSETPEVSRIAVTHVDSNDKLMNFEISSISSGSSSYVDAYSHNLMCSSGISLSFDQSETVKQLSSKSVISPSLSKKLSTNSINNPIEVAEEKTIKEKVATKTSNTLKMNDMRQKMSVKAKSNLNLTRENSMDLQAQKSEKHKVEFGPRSRSYIAPRKNRSSHPRYSLDMNKTLQKNSKTKFNKSEINIRAKSSLTGSRESVNKSMSKSCIPVLKTRLDSAKNNCRPKSLSREPLKASCNKGEINTEETMNSPIAPEGQTVIYVNIVTDHDNCVTKVVDPKKFLKCVKDKRLNFQEIVNDNCHDNRNESNENECSNAKFLTIISSTGKNSMSSYQQREMEVLAKPSITDTSTSISDFPKNKFKSKELITKRTR